MVMSIWDILLYVYKWKYMIIGLVVASALLMNFYISNNQSFSAQTVIKYSSPDAEMGLTSTGAKLDVNEITAPHVISGAIQDLNLNVSAEFIRSHISVEPIIPKVEQEIKKSKIDANQEYEYSPVYYIINFTVGKPFDGAYARNVLDAVIKNYYSFYSETHIKQSVLPEIISNDDVYTYDYLEVAELMDAKIVDTLSYLKSKSEDMPNFRSSATGMSFSDLMMDYSQLKNFVMPTLMSNIFQSQITKNKDVLLKNYAHKKNENLLLSANEAQKAELSLSLMREFVRSNEKILAAHDRRSGDEDIDTTEIIIDRDYVSVKTTYDRLVDQYVDHRRESGAAKIEADYCDSVINAFSSPPPAPETVKDLVNKVQVDITEINDKLTQLYDVTDKTIRDYNAYIASQAIFSMSGISNTLNMSSRLYLFIACLIGLSLGIVLAIVIEILKKIRYESLEAV